MTGFQATVLNKVRCYRGSPTCDDAHAALLAMLNTLRTTYLPAGGTLTTSQKGNFGEFISYHIASAAYPYPDHVRFAGNALNPLSRISGAGLDLVYLYFDNTNPANDLIYIQEVKTTGAINLNYLDELKRDYSKLFGTDPQFTLQSRIQHVQNILEFERGNPIAARRVSDLASTTPATASGVRLIPTGISSIGVGDPLTKLSVIRRSIATFGWPVANIEPWSIVMSDLDDRLIRLSRGLP